MERQVRQVTVQARRALVWFGTAILVLAVLAMAFTAYTASGQAQATPTGTPPSGAQGNQAAAGPETDPVAVVARVNPAVVTVVNEQQAQGIGGGQLVPVGSGTGFIVDDRGHVVTNWHVVDGGQRFHVVFADGTNRPASLIGADQVSDLAVVRVEGDLPGAVPLGDSDALQPGQTVLAIGSPLGSFTNTVTAGIVGALGRNLPDSFYTDLVQHDAPINPGNSGGPLVNLAGEVVGVKPSASPRSTACRSRASSSPFPRTRSRRSPRSSSPTATSFTPTWGSPPSRSPPTWPRRRTSPSTTASTS